MNACYTCKFIQSSINGYRLTFGKAVRVQRFYVRNEIVNKSIFTAVLLEDFELAELNNESKNINEESREKFNVDFEEIMDRVMDNPF